MVSDLRVPSIMKMVDALILYHIFLQKPKGVMAFEQLEVHANYHNAFFKAKMLMTMLGGAHGDHSQLILTHEKLSHVYERRIVSK